MLWKLFQLAVFFGVFALFIENGITDLGMVPTISAALAALLATIALSMFIDLARWVKSLLVGRDKRVDQRRFPRA